MDSEPPKREAGIEIDLEAMSPTMRAQWDQANETKERYLAQAAVQQAAAAKQRRSKIYRRQILVIVLINLLCASQGLGWLWLTAPLGLLWGIAAWRWAFANQ